MLIMCIWGNLLAIKKTFRPNLPHLPLASIFRQAKDSQLELNGRLKKDLPVNKVRIGLNKVRQSSYQS